MATFYIDRFSGVNYSSQWSKHIQTNEYFGDVTKSIGQQTRVISEMVSQQTSEINDTIQGASKEQVAAIQESTNAVCGTLETGFNLLSDHLSEISYSIGEISSELNAMASMLDWKLSLLVEQQRISNLLLGNLAILLRIPDIQKERQYHIEQGIKFLKNAIFDNDFYEDSLNNLHKAEVIEPTDFFALHRIGFIYLYSQKHLNLPKAEEYFKKSAKYAIVETNNGASITSNYLSGDPNKNLSDQTPTVESIKIQAAEAYLFAGRCCYIQGKFDESANLAGKAFNLVPQMVEAGFTQAKSLSANNNEAQAALVLEQVIRTDRFYSLKTISDFDLSPKQLIKNILEKLKQEAFNEALERLNNCKSKIQLNSQGNELLKKIEHLVNMNSFLTSKKAIDLLIKKNSYSFQEAIQRNNSGKWESSIKAMTFNFSIMELIAYEDTLKYKLNLVKELIEKNSIRVKLLSQLNPAESTFRQTAGELGRNEREKTENSQLLLKSFGGIVIGLFILSQEVSGFVSGILWVVGLVVLCTGVFMGGIALLGVLGAGFSGRGLETRTKKLSSEQQNLKSKIQSIEADIQRLEKL